MKKIYSILGDFYHAHAHVLYAVNEAVKQIPGAQLFDRKIEEIENVLAEKPDILVLACENRVAPQEDETRMWLTPALDEKLAAYVEGGGKFLAIHAALASYPADSRYVGMLRGSFRAHPQEHYPVRFVSNEKSVLGDFDFTVTDEFYQLNVDTNSTNVFMTSECDYGQDYGGWWHNFGAGRVLALVPTHNEEGFKHPETIRLYKEGLSWLLN
jgi:type 1 glutamine amidotransferase